MMLLRAICVGLLAVVLNPFGAVSFGADEAALKKAVEQLFDVGWTTSFKARAETSEQYGQIQRFAPSDARAAYAYALIQIKQRRYPDAGKTLDDILERNSRNVHAMRAQIWLSVVTKDYDKSLVEIDRLCKLVPAKASSQKSEEAILEVSRFVGVIFGFLEGPSEGSVQESTLAAKRRTVLAQLGDHRAAAFEKGRSSVLEQFESLTTEKEETSEQAKLDAEAKRKQELEDLDKRKGELDKKKDELGPRREKLQSEAKAELDEIVKEDRPLLDQLMRLENQAILVRREQGVYTTQIVSLQAQAAQTEDPNVKQSILQQAGQLSILASRYDTELLLLRRRAGAVVAQRLELERKYEQTRASYAKELAQLGAELNDIQRLEKRTEAQEKKAGKTSSGDLRRSRALAARAKALTTYEEFPLEQEKQRILASFR